MWLRPAARWLGRGRVSLGRLLRPGAVASARVVRKALSWARARVAAAGKVTAAERAARRLGLSLTAARLGLSAQMAAHGVLAKPLRSALTILGVAIGVASVVSLMGVGEGARQAVMAQFESLGTNVVVVRAEDPSVVFRPEEAEELVERVSRLTAATPVIETKAPVRWRRTRGQLEVLGVNQDFPVIRDHPVISGHFFTVWHVKQRSPVAVLGHRLAMGLMGGRSPVGQQIIISGRAYRILGVLAPKGGGAGDGIDDKVLIPYTTALQLANTRRVTEIWAKAPSARDADLAVVQLGRIYRRQLGLDQSAPTPVTPGGDGSDGGRIEPVPPIEPEPPGGPVLPSGKKLITITSLNRLVKEADKANRIMTLLLGGIAAVSLLVGGLGIMNIMLVAVTERTAEIGVRRALGARQGDLLVQFLLEALILSGIGVIVGIGVGVSGSALFERWGLETAINLQAVVVAASVAVLTGLLFGVYPAYVASSVPPAEALRR